LKQDLRNDNQTSFFALLWAGRRYPVVKLLSEAVATPRANIKARLGFPTAR